MDARKRNYTFTSAFDRLCRLGAWWLDRDCSSFKTLAICLHLNIDSSCWVTRCVLILSSSQAFLPPPTFCAVHDDLLLLRGGRLAAAARLVGVLVLRDDLRQEVDVPDRQP